MEINETMITDAKANAKKNSGVISLVAGLGIAVGAITYAYVLKPIATKIAERKANKDNKTDEE